MKHFPMLGRLAVILGGGLLAAPALWANGDALSFRQFGIERLIFSSPGYLGVDLGEVDADRAKALHVKDTHAAEVVMVDHDAPAGKSGLKPHDVILQLNGQPFDNVNQLRHRLHDMSSGRTVTLLVSRDGKPLNISVQLCDRKLLEQQAWSNHLRVPAPPTSRSSFIGSAPSSATSFFDAVIPKPFSVGAEVNPVGTQLAEYFGISDGTGLLVSKVEYQSPASRAGLKAGDVVLRVESRAMISRNDWLKVLRAHRGHPVQVTVMRNKQEQVLTMSAGPPKSD